MHRPKPDPSPGASPGSGRRILVTGATGFIGRRLCARLAERGEEVTALVRRTSRTDGLAAAGIRLAVGDVATGEGLREAADGTDCVLHLAAVVKAASPMGYWRCNAEGTRRLAEALAELPSPPRLVLCSSLAAAGPSAGPSAGARSRREAGPQAPVSHYGRSKLAGEEAVRRCADRLPAVVVRPPIVYGPGDPAFLPSLAPMVRGGIVLKGGFGPRRYSLLHVEDLCTALLAATTRGATLSGDDPTTGVYAVSDGLEHTWEGICRAVASAMGRRRAPVIVPVPVAAAWAIAHAAELVGRRRGFVPALNRDKVREMRCEAWTCPSDSSDRARRELGFAPSIPLEHGLADLFANQPRR